MYELEVYLLIITRRILITKKEEKTKSVTTQKEILFDFCFFFNRTIRCEKKERQIEYVLYTKKTPKV
jgi:hypothetical protein